MVSFSGIGSGLDIQGLVESLVAAERASSDLQLNRQGVRLSQKFSALGSLKGAISSFQASLSELANLNSYNRKTATSSAATEVGVSVLSSAIPNTYQIEVSQLAESHSLASAAFLDTDSTTLGSGTITISFGTTDYEPGTDTYNSFTANAERDPVVITIDDGNNTLDGIMSAINAADANVTAAVINDGTGFRLLLTSTDTGEVNSLQVTVSDTDGNNTDTSGLSVFAFNAAATNLEQTAAAQDAIFSVNGLGITQPENDINSVIPSVELSLQDVTTGPVSISIEPDTQAIVQAVETFIAGYNGYIETINNLSAYDADSETAGPLIGDFTLRSIEGQVNNILRSSVAGLTGSITNLVGLGITTSAEGTLTLNSESLQNALDENPEEVMQLFAAVATPDSDSLSFVSSSDATVPGLYGVEITAFASNGYFTGTSVLPDFGGGGSLVIDSNNDNLTLEIDGISTGELTLTSGTYTSGDALAAELQARINNATNIANAALSVSVLYDGGTNSLTITSDAGGSASSVEIVAVDGNTPGTLGFAVGTGVDGQDIIGTIGGAPASGVGNILVGAEGTDVEGLRIEVSGVTTGFQGNVNFTRGMASQLDELFDQLLDAEGALTGRISSFEDRLDDLEDRRADLELRWEAIRERYTTQFNALDSLLAQLQATSVYLEGQLDNLLKPNPGFGNNS